MEIAMAIVLVLLIALYANSPSNDIKTIFVILLFLSFWISMQSITVSDDILILSRRFGLFKRIIPLRMIANIDAKLIPVPHGALPVLHIYTINKHIYKVRLCSQGRHVQVLSAIRAKINNTQQGVAPLRRTRCAEGER